MAAGRKIALVTGASKGLGFAVAQKLSAEGYFVILNARTASALVAAQKNLMNPSACLVGDVSEKNFGAKLEKILRREKLSRLDLVIHAAAINHMGTVAATKLENAEATFQINAFSVIRLAQATRSYLEAGVNPRFILVSSLMQYFAMPGRSIYAASKAAAEQFAGAWQAELKAEGSPIRVKIFRPAGIETGFHGNTKTDGQTPRSDVSRMSPEASAGYLFHFIGSSSREMAPGAMNKVVAFAARHFRGLTRYLAGRRYQRRLHE